MSLKESSTGKQKECGVRLTGPVARLVMDFWADQLVLKMRENDITLYLLSKYVDDINILTSIINRGYQWEENLEGGVRLRWSEERKAKDDTEDVSDEERTMELVRELADTLVPGLRFTKDIPGYHTNGKCPMLDVQVWLEDRGDHKII